LIALLAVIFIIQGCSSLRPAAGEAALEQEAAEAARSADHERALALYEELMEGRRSRDAAVDPGHYRGAGLAAHALGRTDKVLAYLEPLRHDAGAGAPVFAALAEAYRRVDNLSREISSLETYVTHYPEGADIDALRLRYFETLAESRNWEQAAALWPGVEEQARGQEPLMNRYFEVLVALDREEEAERLARELLGMNPDNLLALDHLGKLHYRRAEEIHHRETRAYERNRTRQQYARLLKAYEVMNEDFRTALGYFLRLFELHPTRETASFLRNIYSRFGDEERARYYDTRLQ